MTEPTEQAQQLPQALRANATDDMAIVPTGLYPAAAEWNALKEMARMMCITEFVPKDMRGRPYSVLAALMTGRDLGVPPMVALRQIYLVNGRPGMQTALKVALVRRQGHDIRPKVWDSERCVVLAHRKGDPTEEALEVEYTIQDAKAAGDYDKPGDTYRKRPKQMLWARAAGLAVDVLFQDVLLGMPSVEDLEDLDVIEQPALVARDEDLPELRGDFPLTHEERLEAEKERVAAARETFPSSAPPPPPRTRSRGRGPRPNPQQGADEGALQAADTVNLTREQLEAGKAGHLVSDADIARGLGLHEEAEALEHGRPLASAADKIIAEARGAQTAAAPPASPAGAPAAREPAPTPQGPAPGADDPFGGEAEPATEEPATLGDLPRLRRQAETYADFLMRRKLEKDHKPADDMAVVRKEALAALGHISTQLFRHDYSAVTEAELQDTLLPWLRQRYAAEGGKE